MNYLKLSSLDLKELDASEQKETDGGFLGLVLAYGLQAALVGSLAAGVYASFKTGYNAV